MTKFASGQCRVCLCTDMRACCGGCSWADDRHTLCSSCVALEHFTRSDVIAIAQSISLKKNAHEAPEVVVTMIEAFAERGFTIVRSD